MQSCGKYVCSAVHGVELLPRLHEPAPAIVKAAGYTFAERMLARQRSAQCSVLGEII